MGRGLEFGRGAILRDASGSIFAATFFGEFSSGYFGHLARLKRRAAKNGISWPSKKEELRGIRLMMVDGLNRTTVLDV